MAELEYFADIRKMVGGSVTTYLASRLGLRDDTQKDVPVGVSHQDLKVAREPILDTCIGALCKPLEDSG